jgi:hypothetical protein
MSSCSVMRGLALNLAMSCHNIGGNGPPPRDSNQIPLPNTQPVQSVRRKLFGDVDHQQTSRDLERELQQCEERDKIKYNFDFKSEQPLNLPDSRYEWSQLNDPEVDKTLSQQQLSTKLCKKSDEVIANTSQSPSVSSPSNTSSFNVSPSLVLVSRPTSATISLDSQSLASSSSAETISTIGSDVNQTESRVKTTKQSTITGNSYIYSFLVHNYILCIWLYICFTQTLPSNSFCHLLTSIKLLLYLPFALFPKCF